MSTVAAPRIPALIANTDQSRLACWSVPLAFAVAALAVMPFDVAISRVCYKQANGEPKVLRSILDNTEPFGHSVGIVVIAVAVICLDSRRRLSSATILSAGLGAGLLASSLKLLVARTRPRNFDFLSGDVGATYQGLLPLTTGGSSAQSLPSAHTASAVAMAVVLSTIYPRGRVLFGTLAVLVAGHRLHSGAHFPSDILLGAVAGWVVGVVSLAGGRRLGCIEGGPAS